MADLANLIPEALFPNSMEISLGNGVATDYINVGKAEMAWIVVHAYVAAAAAIVLTPQKAYAAAGTGATALTVNVPIWAGIKIAGASDALVRQTDGVAYTTAATAGDHIVVFQIDPATLGYEATVPSLGAYKYLGGTYVGLVGDYISVMCWLKPRYNSRVASQPSYIV